MTPEGRVKKAIKAELDEWGLIRAGTPIRPQATGWYYMPVSNGMGVVGIPDFVGHIHGQFFGIEAKAPGGRASANQIMRHEEIRAAGGIVIVADCVEDLIVLKELL